MLITKTIDNLYKDIEKKLASKKMPEEEKKWWKRIYDGLKKIDREYPDINWDDED